MNIQLQIEESLSRLCPFSGAQSAAVLEKMSIRTLRKNEMLLAPPKVCTFTALVLRGSFRMFQPAEDPEGVKENTLHFFTENSWVGDMESFVVQRPATKCIQAMEKAEIGLLSIHDLHDLIRQDQAFFAMGRMMKEWAMPTNQYTSLVNDSPDVRYQALLKAHPDWIIRFPQMHLASYLGMTRETFSRVKRRTLAPC